MKNNDHLIGDRVSVHCLLRPSRPSHPSRPAEGRAWLGGRVIARDVQAIGGAAARTRYVVQLDDDRRVVAFDDDVRRFSLSFELVEMLERMAS
jgi:hypothetical protein